MTVRTRIAPSPTGMPHIGTIFQALIDYAIANNAKQHHPEDKKTAFVVRIEDTDQTRFVEGAEEAIYKALDWVGLTPDESPVIGGDFGPYRQSDRMKLGIYQKYIDQLFDKGKQEGDPYKYVYYCFCSQERLNDIREKMQKNNLPPMYDKHCLSRISYEEARKRISDGEKFVVRMNINRNQGPIKIFDDIRKTIEFDPKVIDDQVLIKSDKFPTYHLAVVVDDHEMQITHVVRGEEWISSTPKHVLLYQYLGWKAPSFLHTPLFRNPDRSKLAKRHAHSSAQWYKDQGYLPEALLNFLATRAWTHPQEKEVFSKDEFVRLFNDRTNLRIQAPIADLKKLDWYNGIYIRQLSDKELILRLNPYKPDYLPDDLLAKFIPLIKERLERLSDIKDLTSYLTSQPQIDIKVLLKESKLSSAETAAYLSQVETVVSSISDWSVASLETSLHQLAEKLSLKPRPAFMTIRLAVTGRSATPPLFDTLFIIGQSQCLSRLAHAREILEN